MSNTIDQLWGRNGVKAWNTNKAVPLSNPAPGLIYGIELEIENAVQDWNVAGMQVTTDGSLRNNGLEFITSPMTYSNVMHVLGNFFGRAKLPNDADQLKLPEEARNYSDRCSVHVHTNVGNMTLEQLSSLCILYQVFESCLFNFVGHERQRNIFTVPWSETQLSYRTVEMLGDGQTDVIRNWQKYTALNLLPIGDKGSIEWRHMNGTSDVEKIGVWLRLIGRMFHVACSGTRKEVEAMVMSLNTTSLYRGIIEQVFQTDAKYLQVGDYERLIEDGVLNMKYSLTVPPKKKATTKYTAQFMQEMAAPDERGLINLANRWARAIPQVEPQADFENNQIGVFNHPAPIVNLDAQRRVEEDILRRARQQRDNEIRERIERERVRIQPRPPVNRNQGNR